MFESTSHGQIKVLIWCEPEKTMEELQQGTTPPPGSSVKILAARFSLCLWPTTFDLQLHAAKIVSFYSR
jgi:hypothetical protein